MRQYLLAIALLLTASWSLQASDSLPVLQLANFMSWIKQEHPVARNANLLLQQAEAQIRMARGAFDPKLFSDWEQKSFDNKQYFTLSESGMKVMSLWGVEAKTSFNVARGGFLNPEERLPPVGQALLGVNVPLLNGLLFDPNRAGLQTSLLDRDNLNAQRRSLVNDLLLQGGISYINWTVAYYQLLVTQQAYDISVVRLGAIRRAYQEGDRPGVDTLETFTQVQNWQLELNDAKVAYRNAALAMQTWQWNGGRPRLQNDNWNWQPEKVQVAVQLPNMPVDSFLLGLETLHPDLRAIAVDLRQLDIERRLAAEQFKPRLNVSYNLLGRGWNFNPNLPDGTAITLTEALTQNYKWGVNFSFPLFLRKERGKMELVRVKQMQTGNKFDQKRIEVENKLRNYYNEYENTRRQVVNYQSLVDNLDRLLVAERRKFELGESSIFLINTREQKLIESQIKFVKLQGELAKNQLGVYWAAGRLGEVF
jgi:outer membrane protein TolC